MQKIFSRSISRYFFIAARSKRPKWNILHLFLSRSNFFKLGAVKTTRIEWLKREMQKTIRSDISEADLFLFITKLYEKGYSALDLIKVIEDGFQISNHLITDEKRYELLVAFNKVRKEIRNEKIIIMFIINFTFLDRETVLENIASI